MRSSARLVVVPLALALLVTACGRPGTAATVDGDRITDSSVARLVDDLNRVSSVPIAPQQAVGQLVVSPTILDVVADHGLASSDEQATELLDQLAAQVGQEPWDYSAEIVAQAKVALADQALQASPDALVEIQDGIAALDVELNPRFGTWDGGVVPQQWPWLVPSSATS